MGPVVLQELENKKIQLKLGGGPSRIEKQHSRGRLTARERLDVFLDKGSFQEYGVFVEHRSVNFGMSESKVAGDGLSQGAVLFTGSAFVYIRRISLYLADL
ncbi:carboxyl transferase domain protein [Anaplasma phagocytophilum str. ApNP]|uniref:Carboxyl transferase domain protein n=1 Tax=Anaplasma phagocytophilum str. ApNP TaxID=1359153 RepID=A0A0F3NIM7_ANAPH|nr:carboxyl transferase domain protein [Anaplasma phagocytophilum str. ApNP]